MIPLSIPHIAGNEWKYVKECLDTGWISSAGKYVTRFEEVVATYVGAKHGVACVNGTAGLHVCLRLAGIGQGDFVIVPNITFIATLNAIKYVGADPLLLDVSPHDWQLDSILLEQFLTENTILTSKGLFHTATNKRIKAIMPVHVLGNIGDMDRILRLAKQFHIDIIEDSTESLGSFYRGKHSGTIGKMGVFSFNGNKIISTGGGGVIVTDDTELAKKAKHLTTQAKVTPQEYIHDAIGYNYRLVNILAAVGVAQMEMLPQFIQKKKWIDAYYREHLNNIADIEFQNVAEGVDSNCWLFTFKTNRMRALLGYLNQNGVESRPFWMPMNQLPMFSKDTYVQQMDHSAMIYKSCISIPSSVSLTEQQLAMVVSKIKQFFTSGEIPI